MAAAWRVAIICVVPQIARIYAPLLRELGHEPVCVITPRRMRTGAPVTPFAADQVALDDEEPDVLFPASPRSLTRLLAAYDLDLGLCTTFPWRLPEEAIAMPRLGVVNGHPSLLPRYRGPFPVAWAVRNGETEIGLSYHLMDATFDKHRQPGRPEAGSALRRRHLRDAHGPDRPARRRAPPGRVRAP